MNLEKMSSILGLWLPDATKEELIIRLLAEDDSVIPRIQDILESNRRRDEANRRESTTFDSLNP